MPDRGNILLVANWESNVGYAWWLMENFWVTISEYFEKQGKSCLLIYPRITIIPEHIAASNIQVIECDFRNHTIANLRTLRTIIKSYNIKHLYLSDSPPYSLFYVLLRTWGIKSIVVHDHTPGVRTKPGLLKQLFKRIIHRIPWHTADRIIAVTDYVNRRHLEVSCIPRSRCSVTRNGIKPFNLEQIDDKYAYREFNIPENRQIVVTTGRATYYKGIDFFIKCADELINKRGLHQLHFLYCGDGPDIEEFKSLAGRLGINKHFTFAGKRSDIRKILPSCDIGFHASKGEVGYSLSILEYMSAGLATIVADNASTSEATLNGSTGLLFQAGDITSACDKIAASLDKELQRELKKNAIASVENKYNILQTNIELTRILKEVFV